MFEGTVLLALVAGMVAAFNPCGFAMLPAYLGFVIEGTGESPTRAAAVGRAMTMSAAMTAGFVLVFGLFGLVISPLAVTVEQYLPYVTVVIGAALVGLGVWLLSGRELIVSTPKVRGRGPDRGIGSMALYGVAYAVASLSCTIGPFLALVSGTLRSGSVAAGVTAFVAYALGMGIVVAVLAVGVALARTSVVGGMRRVLPYVGRISGALVLVAGLYVAWYGYFEIRVLQGEATDDPIVGAVTAIQSTLTRAITDIGPWLAVIAAALLVALVIVLRLRNRAADRGDEPEASPAATPATGPAESNPETTAGTTEPSDSPPSG